MQSGLGSTSSHNYGASGVSSKHWVEHILDKDFTADINGKMVYSTGSSHLLSVIITKATGMSTKAFAEQYLFTPLDIAIAGWDKDPQGYYMGGNNMALKPSDLLKIGELLLNNGYWNNKQIISRNWIADFKTYTIVITTLMGMATIGGIKKQHDYFCLGSWRTIHYNDS